MKTDELIMELETLEYRITRLKKELQVSEDHRQDLLEKIENNLISDCFEAKN